MPLPRTRRMPLSSNGHHTQIRRVGTALKLGKTAVAKDLFTKAQNAKKIFKRLQRPIPESEWEGIARRPRWRKSLDTFDEDLGIALQAFIASFKWIKTDLIGGAAAWVAWVSMHAAEALQLLLKGEELPPRGALPARGADSDQTCASASASTRFQLRLGLWVWLAVALAAPVVLALT